MFNWIEQLALTVFVGLLHGLVRSPKAAASILNILVEIYNDLGTVLLTYGYQTSPAVPPAPAPTQAKS